MNDDLFGLPEPSEIELTVQIDCVAREIGKRQSVYPRLIEAGKLTPEKSAQEILAMEAVLHTLTCLREGVMG